MFLYYHASGQVQVHFCPGELCVSWITEMPGDTCVLLNYLQLSSPSVTTEMWILSWLKMSGNEITYKCQGDHWRVNQAVLYWEACSIQYIIKCQWDVHFVSSVSCFGCVSDQGVLSLLLTDQCSNILASRKQLKDVLYLWKRKNWLWLLAEKSTQCETVLLWAKSTQQSVCAYVWELWILELFYWTIIFTTLKQCAQC